MQNLNRAIIQWTDRQKNATSYFFSIKEDGTFSIDFSDGTSENQKIFSAALPESFSRTYDYNCLAVCSTDSGDIKISLNQNLLFTIPKSQVNINLPGHFYLGFQPKSGVSYSQENKGIARFRLSKIQDKI